MGGGKGISTPGFLSARETQGSQRTCDACRSELLTWDVGLPLRTVLSVTLGTNVAPMWPHGPMEITIRCFSCCWVWQGGQWA